MFFSAYLGAESRVLRWNECMQQHADWLGLSTQIESRTLFDGRRLFFGWLQPPTLNGRKHIQETCDEIIISTLDDVEQIASGLSNHICTDNGNSIRLTVSLRSGELTIVVPPATPEQCYWTCDAQGYVLANDLRLMARWTGRELNDTGVYALFQYGVVPPPMTLFRDIWRVPGGHRFELASGDVAPTLEAFFQPTTDLKDKAQIADPKTQVRETLDNILSRAPRGTALFFSGGVDSGLIASRLAVMRRRDVRLINLSFGPQDREASLALRMAEHLGLECEQVTYQPQSVRFVLERLGKEYSFPFADLSVIPNNMLVQAFLAMMEKPRAVIDGTAADGAFGLGVGVKQRKLRWNLIYSQPFTVRKIIGAAYEWLKLWRYDSKPCTFGYLTRLSMNMSVQLAEVVAKNSLNGIAYAVPRRSHEEIRSSFRKRVEVLGAGLEYADQCSLLDVVTQCGDKMAAKIFDPLRARGVSTIYPFLEPSMLRLSFSLPWTVKCEAGEPKAILKRMLVQRVPREWVYRPKSMFTPSNHMADMLTYDSMQEFLRDVVMSGDNLLLGFCDEDVLRQMIEQSRCGQISMRASNFLWTLMFASGWLDQLTSQ